MKVVEIMAIPSGSRQVAKPSAGRSEQELLDATAVLLSSTSNLDVSFSEISKQSGKNSALIKYYFGSKEGLLLALLERHATSLMNALETLLQTNLSAEEKLKAHMKGILNAYHRWPYLNRLIHHMIESTNEIPSRRVAEIFIVPMIDAYDRIVKQGVAEGSLLPVEPRFLYFSLAGACDHIFHATYGSASIRGMPRMTDQLKADYYDFLVSLFVRGLAP